MRRSVISCYLCGSSLCQQIMVTSDWSLYKCKECLLLFKVGKKTDYEKLDISEYLVFDYDRSPEVEELCKVIKPYFSDIKGLNVAEIGSGTGSLLNGFQNKGANVFGYEPSRVAAEHSKMRFGLISIFNGYFEENFWEEQPQVYLLIDVIEHLDNPLRLLEKIACAMAEESILVIKSGDYKSINASLYRKRWQYILLPQHIAFYNKRSLQLLCDRTGLRLEYFHRYIDAYGRIEWRKFFKNLVKALLLNLTPRSSSAHNRYQIDIANDHFIAVVRKVHEA